MMMNLKSFRDLNGLVVFFAIGATFSSVASAGEGESVGCEAIRIERAGKPTLRGVRVTLNQRTHILDGIIIDERAVVTFGDDSTARDRAGKLCLEVVKATRCESSPRYENVGDPGFGPSRYQELGHSGTLQVGSLSSSAQSLVGGFLHGHQGQYSETLAGCQVLRANLAYEALKAAQREWLEAKKPATPPAFFQHVPIYEKI
jgi:hypothetical protein